MILLLESTSSILRTLLPFPFVFLPLRVCPLPLNDSNSGTAEGVTVLAPGAAPPRAPLLNAEPGREDPGVDELRSILSLDAIVSGGAGSGLLGST